jgi:AcrR family transcriptional regulator
MNDGTRRRGRPRASEARDTRELLLKAALDLFASHGFAGTSVRQIARDAGLSEAGLYAHFPSKQAIYDELFSQMGPVFLGALDLDPDELVGDSPSEAVPEMVDRLLRLWEKPASCALTSMLLREGTPRAGMNGLAAAVVAARQRLEPVFESWLQRGEFRRGVPAATLVWELFTPLFAVRFLHLHAAASAEDRATARELAQRHVDFFLDSALSHQEGRHA